MKTKLLCFLCVTLMILSCNKENLEVHEELSSSSELLSKKKKAKTEKAETPDDSDCKACIVIDADRDPWGAIEPAGNFWWSLDNTNDWNVPSTYFASYGDGLTFTECHDGTAHISGTSMNNNGCKVTIDVWLKDKKSWAEWSADGGGHKKEGTAGNASNSEEMYFYIIDSEKSTIIAEGNCVDYQNNDITGTYSVEQRPDPNDDSTPNFGVHVGPGGANFDSNIGAYGLAGWGWLTDNTGARVWPIDFNFRIKCPPPSGGGCGETAYAIGNSDDEYTCFTDDPTLNANRWGWTIKMEETVGGATVKTFDIYAGAGQCDVSKGAFVGTATATYENGTVSIDYNLADGASLTEEHFYAGTNKYPTNKKGKVTLAPGQYSIGTGLSGDIYVIIHFGGVCTGGSTPDAG
ncbi:hypothetical protein [Hyunsoonleella rubra]|uniref:Uncharacterized protein n=1 Tax=Hyunsoonleella rubra TaxID=1737062 RepID=A0ABW5TAT6_9FLAO